MKNKILYTTFVTFILGVSSNTLAVNLTDATFNESEVETNKLKQLKI